MQHNSGEKLAFIVGHYKSGSTWLVHLLSLYPGIRGVSECHVFRYVKELQSLQLATEALFTGSAWGSGGVRGFPKFWLSELTRDVRARAGLAQGTAALQAADVPMSMFDLGLLGQWQLRRSLSNAAEGDAYCREFFEALIEAAKPEHYLIEKTPTNVFHMQDIVRVFPRAKLLSIHRDGRDVVLSDKHHLQRAYNTSQSFAQRVTKWREAMEVELASHSDFNIHPLSYEELQHHPEKTVAKLLDFLELPYDDKLIATLLAGASFESMSGGRSAGEENRKTFYRKGVVGDWKNSLTDKEIESFSELAGNMLVNLGYETSPSWRDWS